MQSNATVKSDTAKFTSRQFLVVRIRGVLKITRQTRILPVTLARKTMVKMVYSKIRNHVKFDPALSGTELSLLRLAITSDKILNRQAMNSLFKAIRKLFTVFTLWLFGRDQALGLIRSIVFLEKKNPLILTNGETNIERNFIT